LVLITVNVAAGRGPAASSAAAEREAKTHDAILLDLGELYRGRTRRQLWPKAGRHGAVF